MAQVRYNTITRISIIDTHNGRDTGKVHHVGIHKSTWGNGNGKWEGGGIQQAHGRASGVVGYWVRHEGHMSPACPPNAYTQRVKGLNKVSHTLAMVVAKIEIQPTHHHE